MKYIQKLKELDTILDKWIYFIKNAIDLEVIPEQYENKEEFKDAFFIAAQTTWNKKELEVYDYMKLKEFDEINARRTAIRKAEQKGLEKGIEEEKLIIVKNAISQGLDDRTISLLTGLDVSLIKNLR